MTKPILSREEIQALASEFGIGLNSAIRFAAALESAWLEKLRGEPIYQMRMCDGHWLDCGEAAYRIAIDDGATQENARILYALKTGDES